jgi:hypothetical protein
MSRALVFISCGQYSQEEKQLGKRISEIVRSHGLEPFFAEEVHDLDGLHTNILRALHDCTAFIAVLHPRGSLERPDGSVVVRASVWIEQEIAIAAYIQHIEKRALPVIAFAHRDVTREGIRELLHLNPIPFGTESDVIEALPGLIRKLNLTEAPIELGMESVAAPPQDDHPVRKLELALFNNTNQRFATFNGKLWIPREFLNHWGSVYITEDRTAPNAPRRSFEFSEEGRGMLNPHSRLRVFTIDYCPACAAIAHGGIAASVGEAEFEAKAWLNDQEYAVKKSVTQLGKEALRSR